jgi:hypothetical protein
MVLYLPGPSESVKESVQTTTPIALMKLLMGSLLEDEDDVRVPKPTVLGH